MDESEVEKIGGHLVDEKWPAEIAVNARPRDVVFAKFPQAIGTQSFEKLGIGCISAFLSNLRREEWEGGQFSRAFNRRMARQNLLDQCRSRAREPDDKYRIRYGAAGVLARAEKPGGEERIRSPNQTCHMIGGVPYSLPSRGVSFGVFLEGRRKRVCVLEGLAERQMQLRAIFVHQCTVRELLAHFFQFGGREAESLQVRQLPPGFAESRIERHGLSEGFHRIVEPPNSLERMPIA